MGSEPGAIVLVAEAEIGKRLQVETGIGHEDFAGWYLNLIGIRWTSPLRRGGSLRVGIHDGLGFSGLFAEAVIPEFAGPEYDALMEQLWVIPKLRYEKAHRRNDPEWAAYSYSRPFPSLDPAHFTNYSGSVHADEAALKQIDREVKDIVADAAAFAQESPEPDPSELWTDVLVEA